MKNPLSENMLRFGTKNLSESAKQHLAYLNELEEAQGGNPNTFEKLVLSVPVDKDTNRVIPGQPANFQMIMKKSGDPLPRYFAQYKKYPPILEIKVNGFNIAQKGKITSRSSDGVLTGTFILISVADYDKLIKTGNDPFKDKINTPYINPTSEHPNGALEGSGGVSVLFNFGSFPLKEKESNERWNQSPNNVEIIGIVK